MRIFSYVALSLENVARMEVRNYTEGVVMHFPQFQGLSLSTTLLARISTESFVVSRTIFIRMGMEIQFEAFCTHIYL